MNVEFRRADPNTELRSLMIFDRKVFRADAFHREMWLEMESWWMLLDGRKVGCCGFERDMAFDEAGDNVPEKGTLYLATTGILPKYQGQGLGRLMKAWQLAWARKHGFRRILSNHRASNRAMIQLNRQFGFRTLRRIPGYYHEPREAAVSMELRLKR